MNIVFSASEMYAKCAGVAIYSLLKNNTALDEINVFLLSTDISKRNLAKIQKMCDDFSRKLIIIDAEEALIAAKEDLGLLDFKGGLNTYARALANRIMPETVDRALFVDSDLLITGDLSYIENFDMGDAIVAGVCEIGLLIKSVCYEDVELLEQCPNYLNYGVVLFDLKNWRRYNADRMIKECICQYGKPFRIAEQSILNFTFKAHTKTLPIKFNFMTAVHDLPYQKMRKRYARRDAFPEQEYIEAQKKPAIIHFIGDYFNRPWYEDNICRYNEVYQTYYSTSPWKDEPLDPKPQDFSFLFRLYYKLLIFCRKRRFDTVYFVFRYIIIQFLRERFSEIDNIKRKK